MNFPPSSGENAGIFMNRHQRGLVDACFEEGQYDEGIALLSQHRSQNMMPSASHIRQLLYLSLYPPAINASFSPSKIGKQHQRLVTISSKTAASALSLLVQLAMTNHPERVARALPSYMHSHEDDENDSSESFVAKEAYCISTAKNCWDVLRRGFIHRAVSSSPTKTSTRRTTNYEDEDEDDETSDVVAEHVWSILDFLLILFERDELETELLGLPRHSPLLLNQIPAPRSGKGPRWEADAPLSVILYALTQNDERRQLMGARLTQLLINLCSTNLFDFTMFSNLVFNRVYISAPKEFLAMLVSLPSTATVLKFRITLLHKFICDGGQNITQDSSRKKPHARARPIRRARDESQIPEPPTPQSSSIINQIPLPSYLDIRRSMEELDPKSNKMFSYPWIQYQLLVSFGIYQMQLPVETARDEGWQSISRDRVLSQHLDQFFPDSKDQETATYRGILHNLFI